MLNFDGCHDFVRTPFWVFKHSMERSLILLSNGSEIKSMSAPNRPQSSFKCKDIRTVQFWPNGPCIKLSPLRTRPRVGGRLRHPCGRPFTFLYPLAAVKNTWVLLIRVSYCYLLQRACSACHSSSEPHHIVFSVVNL